mgnify:CR=1 FL=1
MANPVPVTYSASASPVAGGRFVWPAWRHGLTAGWSSNLMVGSYQATVIERRRTAADFGLFYAAPYQGPTIVSDENPFSFSSGVYIPGKRKYFFSGGGHDDWLGSEVGVFDLNSLTWARTDESAKIGTTEDATVPFQTDDPSGLRAWRNPSGRFAPIASHMYGGMCYLPSVDKVHVLGGATYRSGMGSPGGAMMIDVATGHWYEPGAFAGPGGGVNSAAITIPSVTVVNSSLTPTGQTLTDCVFRVFYGATPGSKMLDPISKVAYGHTGFYSADHRATCHGCIVPDPINAGYKAYVVDKDSSNFAVFSRVNIVRADGVGIGNIQSRPYGNTKPAALGNGSETRWIFMGDYLAGNTKIAVFKPGVGLYALDTTDWTWSELIESSPVSAYGDGVWKRFEYMPELQCFGLFGKLGEAFYALPLPEQLK